MQLGVAFQTLQLIKLEGAIRSCVPDGAADQARSCVLRPVASGSGVASEKLDPFVKILRGESIRVTRKK